MAKAQLDPRPHQFEMRKGEPVLVKVVPYVRFSNGKQVIYAQSGKFFFAEEGGECKPKDLPEWVAAEVANLSPEVKDEVGL